MNSNAFSLPLAWRANRRRLTLASTFFVFTFIVLVYVVGLSISGAQVAANFSQKNSMPSLALPFGTDWLGRNMLFRTLKALSLSMTIGIVASTCSTILATLVGVLAALGHKLLDRILMGLIDLLMGIPHLLLLILISFATGRGITGLLIGITVTHWTGLARLMRAEVLQLRSRDYIKHARRLGRSKVWIMRKHILPHLLPQFLVALVLLFPHAILHESALSFLGYGLPPEEPAIGIILAESTKYLTGGSWWLAFFPGLCLVFLVLAFDYLGENLKRLLNPASSQD